MLLVTGATGFIGRNLIPRLAGQARVRIIARRSSRIDWVKDLPGVEIAYASIESGVGLDQALDSVETVIHIAARTMGRSQSDFYRANVEGTAYLIKAMHRRSTPRLLFVSSQTAGGTGPECPVMTEEMPAKPISCYGWSKKIGEELVGASGLDFITIRPPSVYGPYEKEILKYVRLIQRGLCPVTGRGEKRLNLIYVRDLTELICDVVKRRVFNGRIYYVSDGRTYTWSDITTTIAKILGRRRLIRVIVPLSMGLFFGVLNDALLPEKKRIISRDKVREMSQNAWLCSSERARKELGFRPAYDLEKGMSETISWYRERGFIK